jgi:hypothetical protein
LLLWLWFLFSFGKERSRRLVPIPFVRRNASHRNPTSRRLSFSIQLSIQLAF